MLNSEIKKTFLTNNFDIVRLFGALQVAFANHYISYFEIDIDMTIMHAFSGVPVFFFLAGIFIPMSIKNNNNSLLFIKNRVLKIFPLMWISILFSVSLMFIAGYYPKTTIGNFIIWLLVFYLSIIHS